MAVFRGAVGQVLLLPGTCSCHCRDQKRSAEQPGFLWSPMVSRIKAIEFPRRKVSSEKNLNRKSSFYVTCPDIVSATSSGAVCQADTGSTCCSGRSSDFWTVPSCCPALAVPPPARSWVELLVDEDGKLPMDRTPHSR